MLSSQSGLLPRPEYPRPQLVREQWINLNGEWDFEFDFGKSGRSRGMSSGDGFSRKILVPFCPESELSGIGYKDFIPAVWYKRVFTLPEDWKGKRVRIHFGAVDYATEVWINGQSVGKHRGGYSSFSFELTDYLKPGENTVVVNAEDDCRLGLQPSGKQSHRFESHGCFYSRTTGIWQTVWLEALPLTYVSLLRLTSYPENGEVHVEGWIDGNCQEGTLTATVLYDGKEVGMSVARISGQCFSVPVKVKEVHLWGPGTPNLYDLKLVLKASDGSQDEIGSYFGMRTVSLSCGKILINGKPVFQRLVLDQGYYPDGIYTAPSDEALKRDIEISLALGFNGARLHQKVFEPRFLYWADKLGYMVWGEQGSWGLDVRKPQALEAFLPEWLEVLERDYNHPSIIGWCPFNETNPQQNPEVLRTVYRVTKAVDSTRPVIDTSGYVHVETDIYDVHDYDQNPETFRKRYESLLTGADVFRNFPQHERYDGQPYFVSEYGGTWWNPDEVDNSAWGYSKRPASIEEFFDRYRGLTEALLENPKICGFCYTQLYDVEQEVNGLYTYHRRPKFDAELIRRINSQKAAIEKDCAENG